jgi:apolipoprotein N-acyltransferase
MLLKGKLDRPVTGRLPMAGTVFATGAALLYFGTGLHPIWWLTWLAFLPVLLLAPRVPAQSTARAPH